MHYNKLILISVLVCIQATSSAAEVQKDTKYRSAIWVDPDGCQHWVIDTGIEGFMSQRLDRAGNPVCNKPLTLNCANPAASVVGTDGQVSCK